MKNRD